MIFEEDIKDSLKALKEGGVILYPTDTIWGLGCDATNPAAVDKIFKIKARNNSKSLIILVDGIQMLERYVDNIPEIVYELTSVSETPLTIIYPKGKNLAKGVCSEVGSVGIRICNDEFCRILISKLRKPIVSSSANHSETPSPGNFNEIDKSIVNAVEFVVKYRQDDKSLHSASPIIKMGENGTIKIIRE
jgi:L-threonylcarbamoyladenylate synthase